jgi:hypothetical protein
MVEKGLDGLYAQNLKQNQCFFCFKVSTISTPLNHAQHIF